MTDQTITEKTCTKCGVTKPLSDFYKFKARNRWTAPCKTCTDIVNMANYVKNRERELERRKQRYYAHHEEELANARRNREKPENIERRKTVNKAWRTANKEKCRGYHRKKTRKDRLAAIAYYSNGTNVCACCQEYRLEFLAIDHIEGGGGKHRRECRITRLPEWLRQNGYPTGFRVLCHNCNMSRGHYGYCPHEKEEVRLAPQTNYDGIPRCLL